MAGKAVYKPALHVDARELAGVLRAEDQAEAEALGIENIESALVESLTADGAIAATAYDGKGVICMFGVVPTALDEGQVWMVCSDRVSEYKLQALRDARKVIWAWREMFDRLHNVVHEENTRAIAYLRVLGFRIGPRIELRPGKFFRLFDMDGRGRMVA